MTWTGGMNSYWSTKCELEFLRKLGTYSTAVTVSRKKLLQRYLRAMDERKNWAGLDKHVIRAYVMLEIGG
jgi:hypothetical protein